MQVDAVEQRAADASTVAVDGIGIVGAASRGMTKVPARTRIHRRHQHTATRELQASTAAADGQVAVFERLAQCFQRGAVELRQLIQK